MSYGTSSKKSLTLAFPVSGHHNLVTKQGLARDFVFVVIMSMAQHRLPKRRPKSNLTETNSLISADCCHQWKI